MKDLLNHLSASGLHPVVIDENTVFPMTTTAEYIQAEREFEQTLEEPAPSPYLPGTSIRYAWDSTCLSAFKTCPRYYQYTILEGWATREESIHLRFGIEYHQALHDYETAKATGISHDDALFDTLRELLLRLGTYPSISADARPSIRVKTKEHLVRTVVWYLDQFEEDPAETVILKRKVPYIEEQTQYGEIDADVPAMEVSFKFELDWGPEYQQGLVTKEVQEVGPHVTGGISWGGTTIVQEFPPFVPYLLCGHLDRIVRFNDETFVMDRKTTTGSLTDYYYAQFEPNNQMTLYTIAGQIVLGTSIRGVIIDAACIQVGGTIFGRRFTYRTQDQLDEWLLDLRSTLALAEQYAVAGHWPMNDTACSMFGGCRFREVCSKSPGVRQAFLKSDFVQLSENERWNPLKPR